MTLTNAVSWVGEVADELLAVEHLDRGEPVGDGLESATHASKSAPSSTFTNTWKSSVLGHGSANVAVVIVQCPSTVGRRRCAWIGEVGRRAARAS